MQESTLLGNVGSSFVGEQAYNEPGGIITINKTSLPDVPGGYTIDHPEMFFGVTITNPLPTRHPNFTLVLQSKNLIPTYQYNRQQAAARAIQFSIGNFENFPPDSATNVVGYIDHDSSRVRREYDDSILDHQPGRTGSSIFVSEMIHYGGMPMTIDAADNPTTPDCTSADQTTIGPYTVRGWRYCPPEKSATRNWKDHQGIVQYFDSLPGGNPIGTVTLTEIQGVIWTTELNGFASSGTLKSDLNARNAMINRFAPGGNLSTVAIGDYLYIVSHGFLVVGWGPFLGTIDGITYAHDNALASTRSSTHPIPYVADFGYGTDGTGDGTGWLQDPRPRPFYTAATRVFQDWLLQDQLPYLKKRVVPNYSTQPTPVYDNYTASQWQFYKLPDTIAVSVLPVSRLYFGG